MKKLFILFIVIAFNKVVTAQQFCNNTTSQVQLDINQVRTTLLSGGDMWWDLNDGKYEVPKGSGVNSLFAGALWIGGIDNGGQLRVAAQTYRQGGNDFFPGPGSFSSNCDFFDRHWKVNRVDIQKQITNYSTYGSNIPLNQIPLSILEWPARGNSISKSISGGTQMISLTIPMAPFVDVDGDGLYNAKRGDYPNVPGDQAIWWVINDYILPHTESGGMPLNIDVHVLAYAYSTQGILDYTTFYKYKIINQGQQVINDLQIGQWVDVDLGYAFDDFVGSDPSRNMGIGYNGDHTDGPAALAYGTNPPLVGVKFLKTPEDDQGIRPGMTGFAIYNNISPNSSSMGYPELPVEFYNYLTDKWKDGTQRTFGGNGYGGVAPTNIMYPNPPGNGGWSECDEGNPPGDRRFIMSSGPYTFNPGQILELDFAVVWKRCGSQTACLADFNCLGLAADTVQAFFDNVVVTTGIEDNHIKKGQINVYPNPAKNVVNIDCKACISAKEIIVEISDLSGKVQQVEQFSSGSTFSINTSKFAPGIYFISVLEEDRVIGNQKVVIHNSN